jgi:hypothetical protein
MSHSGKNGTVAAGNTITGVTSLATGTVIFCTATQIMYTPVTGTFQSGEQVYVLINVNYITSTTSPDSIFAEAEISGTWSGADTNAVSISGWTTDATRYINIYTSGSARHQGTIASGYRLYPGNASVMNIDLNDDTSSIKIDGIIFDGSGITNSYTLIIGNASYNANMTFSNNIVKGSSASDAKYGCNFTDLRGTNLIYNNIFYNLNTTSSDYGFLHLNGSQGTSVYNNTVYGSAIKGIEVSGTGVTLKNNISYNNGTDYVGTPNSASTNNLSKDTTAPALNTYYISKTLTFANTASDFHLVSTDTDAIDKGTDLGSPYNTDIIGASRPQGSAWDIGAFEYVTAGGAATGFMTTNRGFWG